MTKEMKKYFINDCIITKLNDQLKSEYQAKYLITYNHDVVDFANTKKEAIKIAKNWRLNDD